MLPKRHTDHFFYTSSFVGDDKKQGSGKKRVRRYTYKYNGKELQEELGLNMYAMDMRMYDPAIARWVVQDPVVHHSLSPYNAFDNNPVYWADPMGANSTSWINDIFNNSKSGDTWTNTGSGNFVNGRTGGNVQATDGGGDEEEEDNSIPLSEATATGVKIPMSKNKYARKAYDKKYKEHYDYFLKYTDKDKDDSSTYALAKQYAHYHASMFIIANAKYYEEKLVSVEAVRQYNKDVMTAGVGFTVAMGTFAIGGAELAAGYGIFGTGAAASTTTAATTEMVTLQISKHAAQRMLQRGISKKMVQQGISKGTRYLDPKNGTMNYILRNGFASGKDLLIGVNPSSGIITTVIRGANLVKGRFLPL